MVLNWMAPSTLKVAYKNFQAALAGLASSDPPSFLGLLLTPTFSWQKGTTYMQENACLKAVANQNMNVDHTFT
eukprot:13175591-Alexandrium_andersonii.AAC.1